jgi:hypothetical protein
MNRQYPLVWPKDEPRTPQSKKRSTSPFSVHPERALRLLYAELKRFRATNVILSTDVPVRADGMLYQDAARRRIDDPAAALYFRLGDRDISICCDLYLDVNDNIRALGKIVEAMRTIERYGGQHLSQKSFTGFAALPPPKNIWSILGINKGAAEPLSPRLRREYVMEAFRDRARDGHSKGYDMAELVEARDQALRELGVTDAG